MGATMKWNPVIDQPSTGLSDTLKHIFEEEFLDGQPERELSRDAIPFLRGVMKTIGGKEDRADVREMIDAIEVHGAISIWLQY